MSVYFHAAERMLQNARAALLNDGSPGIEEVVLQLAFLEEKLARISAAEEREQHQAGKGK
jgi:hypothetical protein